MNPGLLQRAPALGSKLSRLAALPSACSAALPGRFNNTTDASDSLRSAPCPLASACYTLLLQLRCQGWLLRCQRWLLRSGRAYGRSSLEFLLGVFSYSIGPSPCSPVPRLYNRISLVNPLGYALYPPIHLRRGIFFSRPAEILDLRASSRIHHR